jgi:hypothetical protein
MNRQNIIRAMAAGAVILTVNFSVQAQVGGALNRARDAAKQATQGASGQQNTGETAQPTTGTVLPAAAAQAAAQQQPWAIGETRSSTAPATAVQVTYTDGVLTFKGAGKVQDFRVDMRNDDRQWARYAKEITSVVAEEGVTHLPNFAFYGCENLTSVSLPSTLVSIGGSAFFGCKSLTSITLPKSLDGFETGTVPDGKGGEYMVGLFGNCTALTEIKVADGNEKYKAVDGVLYLNFSTRWRLAAYPAGRTNATFTVPDQTPVIIVGAFSFCTALKEITLPQSCGELQASVFWGCTALEKITLLQPTGAVRVTGGGRTINTFEGVDMTKIKILVPAKILENYTTQADSDWRRWASQISGI